MAEDTKGPEGWRLMAAALDVLRSRKARRPDSGSLNPGESTVAFGALEEGSRFTISKGNQREVLEKTSSAYATAAGGGRYAMLTTELVVPAGGEI